MWICSMAPLIFQSARISSKTVYSRSIPLAGTAELEPGDLPGTSPCPLLRVPVASVLHDGGSASSAPTSGAPSEHRKVASGPIAPPSTGVSPTQACPDPFVHHLDEKKQNTPGQGPLSLHRLTARLRPLYLTRLNADQRDSFLQVWHKLPEHRRLRDI